MARVLLLLFRRCHCLNELRFDLKERLVVGEHGAVDEEDVFGSLAERGDAGRLQVDAVLGQHFGDAVEQARPVRADDVEDPGPAAFVGQRRHDRAGLEGDIAFVFGTERSGMTNEEVMLCQGCAAIAADPASPSLNLAQAVQITAYEMHMALMAAEGHEGELYDWQSRFEHEQPASVEAVEGFFRHWEEAMTACGVHDPANPKFLMPITRRLFGRSGLTQTEIDLLRGICAAIIRPKRERKGSKTGV